MIRIRKTLAFVALALALAAADAHAQAGVRWQGSRSEPLIHQAVRHYGFQPNRLTPRQVNAIQGAWAELLGTQGAHRTLSRPQATAIVYMALVHPLEQDGGYDEGRPGRRPGGGWDDRPGDDAPPRRGEACLQMESDAYRLENLIRAPERNSGLFVTEPQKGRARALARQIQQRAIECRASTVADRASDVLTALSANLPERSQVAARVISLKQAIQRATPSGPRRNG